VPTTAELPFRSATIAIAHATGWLRRLAIVETSGQRRTLVLTTFSPNVTIPPAEVAFTVPRGVRIVTP
jgi:outer membrane lipoprotein-sorting protein